MEKIANKYRLDIYHQKKLRKGKPLCYRILTSFRIIKWDSILAQLGIIPKSRNSTTHQLIGVVNGYGQHFRKADKFVWFLLFFTLIVKVIVTLMLRLITVGNFPPLLIKKGVM